MIALCDQCQNYDTEMSSLIREVWDEVLGDRPKSIWCKETDQPEYIRWETCPHFKQWSTYENN